jgi:hypothetical protein
LTSQQLAIVEEESERDDAPGQQTAANSFKHGMRAQWESVRQASNRFSDYLSENVAEAQRQQSLWEGAGQAGLSPLALEAFTRAAHALTDSRSPAHRGFQDWWGLISGKTLFGNDNWRKHKTRESSIDETELQENQKAVLDLFKQSFPGYAPADGRR